MPTQYLVPCSCGARHPVSTAQAGQNISCSCGKRIEVPTLRDLNKLERVEPAAPARAKAAWGMRGQVVLLGVIVLLLSLVAAGFVYLTRPTPGLSGEQTTAFEDLTPADSWLVWQMNREAGLPTGTDKGMIERMQYADLWLRVAFVAAGLGVVIVIIGLALPSGKRR